MSARSVVAAAALLGALACIAPRPAASAAAAGNCARNVPFPVWVRQAVTPPPEAVRLGLSGRVFVSVSVDEHGHATDAFAASANDPMFVEPVLSAARTGMYVPGYVNCVPVASTYGGWVSVPVAPRAERIDVRRFFPGEWMCSGHEPESWRATRDGVERVRPSIGQRFVNDRWKPVEIPPDTLERRPDGGWTLRRDGVEVGRARPWIDERWTIVSDPGAGPEIVHYRVTGAGSFERLTVRAYDRTLLAEKSQTCVRTRGPG